MGDLNQPQTLNLVGTTLMAIQQAADGVILSVMPPRDAEDILLPEILHVAFMPIITLNLPPGTQATAEALEAASRTPRRELMLRTHHGPLPEQMRAIASYLAPELFAPVLHQTITGTCPPRDGSHGVVLLFGSGAEGYELQIDLAGVNLLKYEQPKETAETMSGDSN
jgi:hypothetical protein